MSELNNLHRPGLEAWPKELVFLCSEVIFQKYQTDVFFISLTQTPRVLAAIPPSKHTGEGRRRSWGGPGFPKRGGSLALALRVPQFGRRRSSNRF